MSSPPREELEYSRKTWNTVRLKTAASEREWRALRDEFAARRLAYAATPASSESGFSDAQTEEDESNNEEEKEVAEGMTTSTLTIKDGDEGEHETSQEGE
jgi:hypothetical protein